MAGISDIRHAKTKANRDLEFYEISVILSGDTELPYTVVVSDPGGHVEGEGCYNEEDVVKTLESLGELYKEYEEDEL